jgi:nicotinate-nucleotide adenylyltransferase
MGEFRVRKALSPLPLVGEGRVREQPIGILGGTFDPIHNGHMYIATEVLQHLPVAEIKFIPCKVPVHREVPHASPIDRITMIHLAIEGQNAFSIDQREINRESPSFMIETVISLRADYPRSPLCLILGTDVYQKICSWKDWQNLLNYAHFVVVNREQSEFKHHPNSWFESKKIEDTNCLSTHLSGGIFFLEISPSTISATDIRQKIKNQEDISDLVPAEVATYIMQHGLYK